MVPVILADGQSYAIDVKTILRIRRSIDSDAGLRGNTRVDAAIHYQVLDEPGHVAKVTRDLLPSLVQFTTRDGTPVWVDALKAIGPRFVASTNMQSGVRSAFVIGGKTQYVSEDPQSVADIISSGGGVPLPIYPILSETLGVNEPLPPEWE